MSKLTLLKLAKEYKRCIDRRDYVTRELAEATKQMEQAEESLRKAHPLMLMPISALDIPEWAYKKLIKLGYVFVYELTVFDGYQLPKGVGIKTYEAVRDALGKSKSEQVQP